MSVATLERLLRRYRYGLVIGALVVSLAFAVAVHHYDMSGSGMAAGAMTCLAFLGAGLALALAPSSIRRPAWIRLPRASAARTLAPTRYHAMRARDGPAVLQVFLS